MVMKKTKLSIIIPVYNEKDTLLKILKKVELVDIGDIEKEIIIIDDYSNDGTTQLLKTIKKHKVYFHSENKGKGAAIKLGLKKATGDLVIIQDADLEYDPNDYKKLIQPIIQKKFKVVYGSRFLKNSKNSSKGNIKYYFGNKMLSFFTSILYFNKITDMETCYKVFDAKLVKSIKLNANKFDFEPEITSKILKRRIKILEIPISYNPRKVDEGKKIKIKDGFAALFTLIKYRFMD